ncbi:hypothetical protein GCM10009001_02840 [Virgibacillus siamensis]|uniref:Uncharacterized protein n=1 Tax=Virgibacillus siamensis TaxID=480071 RepID=A0ABP3QG45_9BACI
MESTMEGCHNDTHNFNDNRCDCSHRLDNFNFISSNIADGRHLISDVKYMSN